MSPVHCVPKLCPCVDDLLPILHPEAFLVGCVGSGEVTLHGNRWRRVRATMIRRQDDLIRGIDLWFWKTETVKPYPRTRASSCFSASFHAVVAVGCMLFLYDLCRRVSMK